MALKLAEKLNEGDPDNKINVSCVLHNICFYEKRGMVIGYTSKNDYFSGVLPLIYGGMSVVDVYNSLNFNKNKEELDKLLDKITNVKILLIANPNNFFDLNNFNPNSEAMEKKYANIKNISFCEGVKDKGCVSSCFWDSAWAAKLFSEGAELNDFTEENYSSYQKKRGFYS